MDRSTLASFFGIALLLLAGSAVAQVDEDEEDYGGDELMFFEDLPVVVTASRRAQPILMSSAPVSIITAADIHASGLTSIPEVLQFAAGVDVLPVDRNRYAVGVRGLHDEFSERTLTLIDGRAADSPSIGGFESFRVPVFLEDIERIEILRGPGGAAWGANAFTGVINIITKRPDALADEVEDRGELGLFATGTVTDHPDGDSQLRWSGRSGDLAWRSSVGYREFQSSDEVLDGGAEFDIFDPDPQLAGLIGFQDYVARDASENWRFDGEAAYALAEETQLRAGFGYAHLDRGDREFVGEFQQIDDELETYRAFARVEHALSPEWGSSLQWFGNFEHSDYANIPRTESSENDVELQFDGTVAEDHTVSIGGNFRWVHINADPSLSGSSRFVSEPFDEQWTGLYALDRWQVASHTALEAQVRGDYYSEGAENLDWSGRLSAFQSLDDEHRHVLRVSAARAYRSPKASLRNGEGSFLSLSPMGGGPFLFDVEVPENLQNEETWSLEAGYTAAPIEGVTLRLEGYFQRFEDLIGRTTEANGPLFTVVTDNIDGADALGLEFEASYSREGGRISGWYAYQDFDPDRPEQNLRGLLPAKHKVGATGRLDLPLGLAFNANYRWSDVTPIDGGSVNRTEVPSYHRLDLALARPFLDGQLELAGGVWDVINDERDVVFALADLTAHEVAARTFFARLQVRL